MNTNNTFKLGRSVAQIVPFYRRIKHKEVITSKLIILMAGIAVAKIAVLVLWSVYQTKSDRRVNIL